MENVSSLNHRVMIPFMLSISQSGYFALLCAKVWKHVAFFLCTWK